MPLADRLGQITIAGCNYPHVHPAVFGVTQPLELARLEHAQQFRLYLQRKLSYFVQEDRRAVCRLKTPGLAGQRAGISSPFPAEQFAFHQCLRQRRAVDLDHQAALAGTEPVDGPSQQFLACARFSSQQHHRVGGSDLFHLVQHLQEGPAAADNLVVRMAHLAVILETIAFRLSPILKLPDFGIGSVQRLFDPPALSNINGHTHQLLWFDCRVTAPPSARAKP